MSDLFGVIARDPAQRATATRAFSSATATTGSHRLSLPELGSDFAWPATGGTVACTAAWNDANDILILLRGEIQPSAGAGLRALHDAYERDGLGCLAELNGIFAGVIIDRRRQRVTVFNDRFGLGRVYYHEASQGFHFSTGIPSLLQTAPVARAVDRQGLAEFFSVGCVLQNRTLLQGVFLLPPGSVWTFHADGRVEKSRYFDPQIWEQQPTLSAESYGERLADVFGKVVTRYCAENGRQAVSLTGGLDSRMLLAWSRATPGSLPCYTFGGPFRDSADVRDARRLAELAGQTHTTIRIDRDFFAEFTRLAEDTIRLSGGTMDVSGAVELYVNRVAATIAPVRLTGNYGSEILRANVAFRPGRLERSNYTPEFLHGLDEAADTYHREARCHRLSFIAFKQVPWHHYARRSIEQSQLTPRSPFLDNELVALAYQAPPECATSAEPLLNLIARGNPRLGTGRPHAKPTGLAAARTRLAQAWDVFTAKAEYAFDYGMPDWLARADQALHPTRWERCFLGRHKFYHFRIWYRDRLRDHLDSGAADSALVQSCYRPGVARSLIGAHLAGRANHTLELHRILTLQLFEKLLLGNRCASS